MKIPLHIHLQNLERRGLFFFVLLILLFCLPFISCKSEATKFYETGQKNYQTGKLREAKKNYQDALKIEPKNVKALYALGWVHLSFGELNDALIYFSKCIKYDDKFYGGYKGLGGVYAQIGDFEKSKENYQIALKKNPKKPRDLQ